MHIIFNDQLLLEIVDLNNTPDVFFGAIDYGNITDYYGFKYYWVEIVTQDVVSPISKDGHKGVFQDYITILIVAMK